MSGGGRVPRVPKDQLQRPNTVTEITVTVDDEVRGPDLPKGRAFHPRTVVWYDNMRKSEVAQLFLDSDWDFLLDTAMLHTEFWHGQLKLAAELRLRAAAFGITPEHRARLRLNIVPKPDVAAAAQAAAHEESVAAGTTIPIAQRRAALGK